MHFKFYAFLKLSNIDTVSQNKKYKNNTQFRNSKVADFPNLEMKKSACFWCCKSNRYTEFECPARKAICNRYEKLGHYEGLLGKTTCK